MSTIINNEGFSHSNTLQIPDILNVSNITPSTGNIITIENTKSLRIPRHPAPGSSVESTGENGQMRFNTTSNTFEFYRNSNWTTLNYGSIGDSSNNAHVIETFPTPTNTFQFYGYDTGYGNNNFSSLKDLYSDASFQLFGGAILGTTTGIYTDGTDDWAAFPKEVTNFGNKDFTISWWMTLDDLTSNSQILSLSYDANNSILIQYSSGNIELLDKRQNSTTQHTQTLTQGKLYNYVLVREGLNFKLYLDHTEIIDNTTTAGYTFPDMYANYGTANYNTINDNFVSFGASAPDAASYTKTKIYRVDIWNKAINTQANIDNIYYNGYIYPFYNGMKMVVNNKLGLHIQPTDYTVQYINYNKGYVGIGHTEPECMLDVSGSIGLHSLTIDDPNDEGQSKLYYKTDSGLTLEMSGNDYWSRTAIGHSETIFSTGSNSDTYGHRIQTGFDNNMSFANTSYNAPTPTPYATLGPIVKIKDNAIVGKSFVEANGSSAPSNTLIIENALELNNSDVKSYFKDAIAAYFFEVDGGVGSIEDVVRGPGHAVCDVSHNVYDETKLTNYGFDLSGADVSSFMSIPDMYLPSNGEFSICVRYFKSSTANGEDIYNAGIQSIYSSSEQIGTLNIRTDSGDHTKLFIQFGGFKNDGYVNFTTSTGVLATNTWHFIVVNIKPHLSPEIYVNGIFKAVTTSLTNNNAIDGVAPDYPGNYGNLMLTPQKAYDNTSNNVSGTIDGVNIGTVRPYSYTFGVGSTTGNGERKYYSTYMVFGRTLTSDDTSFWTTALDGYEYCLGDLIKEHRGDKFNAHNRVYIDNSYVLHAEEANFQKNASTRGDVKANRLVAGNVTLEHGKAIIATPSSSKGLISAYYFQKYGAKGSIEDDVRGNGYEIKNRLNDSYDSKTYLGTYGINHALTATPDSYTGAQVSGLSIVNSYCSIPTMQLPDTGVFTLQFRYYVKHDNQTNGSDNEFWRATITDEGNNSRVTNSGTLSLIRKGGGIGNSSPDYEGWTLYAHDNDGGGKAFQINGNWKGYEVAQWNTLTLVIKPYSTPIIYLNGVFAPFTDATRYNIINSDWSSKDIGPVTGTPGFEYTSIQYITFGGYNGGTGGDTNFKQSTQQFQGYIGSYQIFNYALSPDDISYWFYALNGQGASKPKTLSVGKKQSNDREHGINYDAKYDYVTKYNKSLQHISASDSMKMVICNQINRSHGNTLIYKQDQATRFGFKQSSNTDIALNPDVTMEVAHTFRTSNDFLFNSGSIIYNINNDNTTVFDGTTASVWPYGLYNKLEGERYDTNGIRTDIRTTPNWIFQSDNTIKTDNNGKAEILYINRSALNSNHFTIECQIKPNDDDFAGIVLGVDPNTYQALVLYIYPQAGIIRIQLFSEGSGVVGDNKFVLDYTTGASNVLAESTSHNSNTYSFSNGTSVYINDGSSSPFYNVKAIINNNIINAYIDNTLIFTVIHSYQHILDKRNIGILSSVMGINGGVTFKDLRVYNYSSMTMHYLNTNSVNNVNNEIYNSTNDANFGNSSGETWKDWRRTVDNNGGGTTPYTFNYANKTITMPANQDQRFSLFNPGNYTNYVYSVDIKPVDDDTNGIVISASQPNNFNTIANAAYDSFSGFRFVVNGGNEKKLGNIQYKWFIHKYINGTEVEIAAQPNFIPGYWVISQYHRLKVIVINNTIKFYIIFDIEGTPTEQLIYTHYDTDNIILQGNHFGVFNHSGQHSIYKNIVLTELEFTDEITLQGIDNTITIASNTISSDGNLHFTGNLHITGNLRLPHSAIENITYKSSTHIKNIIDINKVTENVVIKPTNTTSTSAVEIINTNNNNEFMTLNSGDSSDTTEQVRFNKSGVGIGTTNAENYALNVVGGNANCYGVYPVGSIIMFGGRNGSTNVPSGWLLCDGTEYANDDYPMLASIIGTNYGGTADSSFNVPNLTHRSGVGSADVTGINFSNDENVTNTNPSNKRGGNASLSTNQLASHTHNVNVNYSSSNWNNNIDKGSSGTSHSGGSGTFDKYFPFTYNYNSGNQQGVGRFAFNSSKYAANSNSQIKTNSQANNSIRQTGTFEADNNEKAHYMNGLALRHMGALINTASQTNATNTSGIVVGGNIANTIEKAYNNADVKYYYNVNSTRNQSNITTATIGSTTQTGNTDFYPKSTRIRYIIYSGVHNTTTYPWK